MIADNHRGLKRFPVSAPPTKPHAIAAPYHKQAFADRSVGVSSGVPAFASSTLLVQVVRLSWLPIYNDAHRYPDSERHQQMTQDEDHGDCSFNNRPSEGLIRGFWLSMYGGEQGIGGPRPTKMIILFAL